MELPNLSNGIKHGPIIRVPIRGDEKFYVGCTVRIEKDDLEDLAVITTIIPHRHYNDVKVVFFNIGPKVSDGQVLLIYIKKPNYDL